MIINWRLTRTEMPKSEDPVLGYYDKHEGAMVVLRLVGRTWYDDRDGVRWPPSHWAPLNDIQLPTGTTLAISGGTRS